MSDTRNQHQRDDAATDQERSPASHNRSAADHIDQDQLDRDLYAETRRRGVSTANVALYLGWSPQRAARIKKQIHRYKQRHPLLMEQALGNMRLGAESTLWFPQVKAESESISETISSVCPQVSNSGLRLEHMKPDFAAQLARANSRLDELILEGTATDTLITELTIVAAKAETAAQVERETAYIESRPEKDNVIRAALVAQKKLDDATFKTRTINGAIERQKEAIRAIQADIVANRDALFLEEADRLRQRERLIKQAREFSELVYETTCLSGKHGVNGFALLYPAPPWSYPTNVETYYVEALYQLIGAAYKFHGVQWTLTWDQAA